MRRINIDKTTTIKNISIPSKVEPSYQFTKSGKIIINKDGSNASIFLGIGDGGVNHGIYSMSNQKWIIYADNDATTIKTPSNLTLLDHNGPVGQIKDFSLPSDKTLATSTYTNMYQFSLDAGVWVLQIRCRFPATTATTGNLICCVSTTSLDTSWGQLTLAPENRTMQRSYPLIVAPVNNNTTYYVVMYQSTGSPMTITTSGNNIRAVRIR